MKNKRVIPVLILLIIIVYLAIYLVRDIPKNKHESFANTNNVVTNNTAKETPKKEEWKDNNPLKVGLYYNDKEEGKRILKKEYTAAWTYHKDIVSFNVFYTDEEKISNGNLVKVFEDYMDSYDEDISNYRIGFIIEFNDQKVQIISPKDTETIYDMLEIYLYDAIAHKNDSWYSHTTEDEFNKNTLLQGIKLTAGKNIKNIETDIKVTVFTYDEDDFDNKGLYKGNCTYSLTVKKD